MRHFYTAPGTLRRQLPVNVTDHSPRIHWSITVRR
jgi:hypothetical protein